jgi:hypothetical protein
VSQIHRFHLRLGYDALTACFLVISVDGRTAPLLPQFCSSSFFHAAGAPYKAPAIYNFSLTFSECRRRAVKNTSQSSRTVAVRRLNWHRSVIFKRQYDFSSATCMGPIACVHPQGARRGTGVPPTCHWKVDGRVEGCDVLPDGTRRASFSPPIARKGCPTATLRWLLTTRDHFLADI